MYSSRYMEMQEDKKYKNRLDPNCKEIIFLLGNNLNFLFLPFFKFWHRFAIFLVFLI